MSIRYPVTTTTLGSVQVPRCEICSKRAPIREMDRNGKLVCPECSVYEPLVIQSPPREVARVDPED